MKKFTILSFLAFSILAIASCNKQYNENVVGQGANGSGGGTSSINWNWTGTAPVSLQCDTSLFQGVVSRTTVTTSQYAIIISSADSDNLSSVILTMPIGGLAGSEYSIPMNGALEFESAVPLRGLTSTSGAFKIITNNASLIEGYFYATTTDQFGTPGATVNVRKGYFRVAKP